jgi:hypothetical protein
MPSLFRYPSRIDLSRWGLILVLAGLSCGGGSTRRLAQLPIFSRPLVIRDLVVYGSQLCAFRVPRGASAGRLDCTENDTFEPHTYRTDVTQVSLKGHWLCVEFADGTSKGCLPPDPSHKRFLFRKTVGLIRLPGDRFKIAEFTTDGRKVVRRYPLYSAHLPGVTQVSANRSFACGLTKRGVLCRPPPARARSPWDAPTWLPPPRGDVPTGWLSRTDYRWVRLGSGFVCAATERHVDCLGFRGVWPRARPVVLQDVQDITGGNDFVCGRGSAGDVRCVGPGAASAELLAKLEGSLQLRAAAHMLCGRFADRVQCLRRARGASATSWTALPPFRLHRRSSRARIADMTRDRVRVAVGRLSHEYERLPSSRAGKRSWVRNRPVRSGRPRVEPGRCVVTTDRQVRCGRGRQRARKPRARSRPLGRIVTIHGSYLILDNGQLWSLSYRSQSDPKLLGLAMFIPLFWPLAFPSAELVGADPVKAFAGVRVTAVGKAGSRTCVIDQRGAVVCRGGYDTYGQVSGKPSRRKPGRRSTLAYYRHRFDEPAVELYLRDRYTCARLESGKVRCWGCFGDRSIRQPEAYPKPTRIKWPAPFTTLRAVETTK